MKITFDFLQMDIKNAIAFLVLMVAACVQLWKWSGDLASAAFAFIDRKFFRSIYNYKLDLQAAKLYDTLKFIAAPHVLENKTHVPKTSEQCVAAARVAIAQYEDFKKGRT